MTHHIITPLYACSVELSHDARIQIAAACHLMGPTENHPHAPPRSANPPETVPASPENRTRISIAAL